MRGACGHSAGIARIATIDAATVGATASPITSVVAAVAAIVAIANAADSAAAANTSPVAIAVFNNNATWRISGTSCVRCGSAVVQTGWATVRATATAVTAAADAAAARAAVSQWGDLRISSRMPFAFDRVLADILETFSFRWPTCFRAHQRALARSTFAIRIAESVLHWVTSSSQAVTRRGAVVVLLYDHFHDAVVAHWSW